MEIFYEFNLAPHMGFKIFFFLFHFKDHNFNRIKKGLPVNGNLEKFKNFFEKF